MHRIGGGFIYGWCWWNSASLIPHTLTLTHNSSRWLMFTIRTILYRFHLTIHCDCISLYNSTSFKVLLQWCTSRYMHVCMHVCTAEKWNLAYFISVKFLVDLNRIPSIVTFHQTAHTILLKYLYNFICSHLYVSLSPSFQQSIVSIL